MMTTARRRSPPRPTIEGIFVRFRMTFDAAVAVWLLRMYGHIKYEGAFTAPLVFLRTRDLPEGLDAEEWERRGYFAVNCGESRFDHHPHGRYKKECAATLVMRDLGIYDNPTLRQLKEWVLWDDLRRMDTSSGRPTKAEMSFTWARTFKEQQNLFDWYGSDDELRVNLEGALEDLFKALNVHVGSQERFFCEGKEACANARAFKVEQPDQRKLTVVVAASDSMCVSAYARSQYGYQADIFVQHRSSGQVQIAANSRSGLDFDALSARIRYLELSYRDPELLQEIVAREGDGYDAYMSQEGTIVEVEEWYYMKADDPDNPDASSMMLNGSTSHPYVPPTNIPIDGENSIETAICEAFS